MVVDGVSGDARQPAPPPYFFHGQGQNGNGDDKFTGLRFSSDQELQLYKRLAEKSFHDMQMKYSYHQTFDLQRIVTYPELHLKLRKSQSFIYQIEVALLHQSGHGAVGRPRKTDSFSQQFTEKLKASNFSACFLKIGKWERVSLREGDLVAKCYYAKKKLVWEFLERTLKRKIEIQWGDILAIRATMNENEPGILEVELKNPPTFHHETDPQPRKHTNWKAAADFTDGQAPIWRRHYLKFPPGVLDKPFEKLLQCDDRLNELSRRTFPSLESPYFCHQSLYEPMDINFGFHRQRPHFNPALQLTLAQLQNTPYVAQQGPSYQQIKPYVVQQDPPYQQIKPYVAQQGPSYQQIIMPRRSATELASPDSVMEFGENPGMMTIWGQGVNSFADNLVGNQVQGVMPVPSITPADVFYPNNSSYIEGGSSCGRNFTTDMCLNHIEKMLMSDAQPDYPDIATMEAISSQSTDWNNLFCNTNATNNTIYGQNVPVGVPIDLGANQTSNEAAAGPIIQPRMTSLVTEIPQPISAALSPQVTNEIPLNYYDYGTANDHHHHHHHGQNSWSWCTSEGEKEFREL